MVQNQKRSAGFVAIESMLSAAFTALILGGFVLLMRSARGPNETGEATAQLQEIGRRIIVEIGNDLKNAGIRETGGVNYPEIFERPVGDANTPRGNLVASMSFGDAGNAQYQWARNGENESRIERNRDRACDELVFTPIDYDQTIDGNPKVGWPLDSTNNDQIKWDADEVNYRVVRDASGTPWLERRINDQTPRKIGPFVQNITFDCLGSDRTLLYNQVAIVVYLATTGGDGRRIESAVEGVVNLGIRRDS
ncbi:MAG: hypothetical protein U1E76_03595 [Planctomycetota bacterium]